MPEWVWIGIVIAGGMLTVVLLGVIAKAGGKIEQIRIGKTAFVIHGKDSENNETPLGKALQYVPDHIGQISSMLIGRFYKLVKNHGVCARVLTEMEDSRFASLLVSSAVARGNGSNSAQKIIESEILSQSWVNQDIPRYVRNTVVPRVLGSVRQAINDHYDSTVAIDGHTNHERVVSKVEWYDDLVSSETEECLTEIIVPFFVFAEQCLDGHKKS